MSITLLASGENFLTTNGGVLIPANGVMSFSSWIRHDANPVGIVRVFQGDGSYLTWLGVAIAGSGDANPNRIGLNMAWNGATGADWRTADNSLAFDGKWHHVCVTYDRGSTANTPIVYIDGVSSAITTINAPVGSASLVGASNQQAWGNRISGTTPVLGAIAHGAIWSRILSANEVQRIRAQGPLACPIGLLVYYPFDRVAVGGALTPLVGTRGAVATAIIAAQDYGDPYHGQYVGSRTFRRFNPANYRAPRGRAVRATVSGTVTASVTEADIVTGSKTIIHTLGGGETWMPD